MEISTRKEKGVSIVSLNGRLDSASISDGEKALFDLIDQGEKRILLNLTNLEYINSSGLRIILASAKKLKVQKGTLSFTGLQGVVRQVFEISGFYGIFKVFDSESDALAETTP